MIRIWAIMYLVVACIVIPITLIRGKWFLLPHEPITRKDNPAGFFAGLAAIAAPALVAGYFLLAGL